MTNTNIIQTRETVYLDFAKAALVAIMLTMAALVTGCAGEVDDPEFAQLDSDLTESYIHDNFLIGVCFSQTDNTCSGLSYDTDLACIQNGLKHGTNGMRDYLVDVDGALINVNGASGHIAALDCDPHPSDPFGTGRQTHVDALVQQSFSCTNPSCVNSPVWVSNQVTETLLNGKVQLRGRSYQINDAWIASHAAACFTLPEPFIRKWATCRMAGMMVGLKPDSSTNSCMGAAPCTLAQYEARDQFSQTNYTQMWQLMQDSIPHLGSGILDER
jgi:hypothetical protein